MKKQIFLALIISIGALSNLVGQDPHFSQYNESPVYFNPALAGVSYDFRAVVNYRSQWASVAVPYKSYGASIDFAVKHKKLNKRAYWTGGLLAYDDVSGDASFTSLNLGGLLGVVIKSGKYSKLSMGLSGSFNQRSLNGSKLTWDSQYNGYRYDASLPGESIPQQSFYFGDYGGGFNWHYAKSERYISAADGHRFDIGFSVYHGTLPFYSFYGNTGENLHMKFIQHANFIFALPGIKASLMPSYILMLQGPSFEANVGLMFRKILSDASVHSATIKPVAIAIGGYYRALDAFIPQVQFEYAKYAIGFSYDFNFSGLTPYSKTRGAMEICLRYNFNPGYGTNVGNTIGPRPTPMFK